MAPKTRFATPVSSGENTLTPKSLTKQEFGKRLFHMMVARKWNQSDLARASGLGRDAVSTYIRGRSFPEPKSLARLAEAFGVSMEELLPNSTESAIDAEMPALEIKQSASDPSKVWLRINRMVDIMIAAKIFDLLKDQK